MPLLFPSSPTLDQTYVDANSTTWIFDGVKWNVLIGEAYRQFNGARVSLNTAATLTLTPTPLTYDVEEFDTGNYFTFTAAERFTITETGYYRIASTYYTGSGGSGSSYTFNLRQNGVTDLTTQICAANQAANYDATAFLTSGTYLDVLVSESTATGTLLPGSFVEVTKLGNAPGAGINRSDRFSGARVYISSAVLLTATPTAISWSAAEFDVNADVSGNNYWNVGTPSRITARISGYYQLKSFLTSGVNGADNSHTVVLRKNGTTALTTTIMSPNDTVLLDEIFNLAQNDYLEIIASNSGSVGSILTSSYIEIIRLGV